MERIFGRHYDSGADFDKLTLPDPTPELAARHVHSWGSAAADAISVRFRERIAAGETLYLLGFQGLYHNAGVALVEASAEHGIRLLANLEEERFAGKKHFAGYPEQCIAEIPALLEGLGKTTDDLFCVLFGWNVVAHEETTHKGVILNPKITDNPWYLHLSYAVLPAEARDRLDGWKKTDYYIFAPMLAEVHARLCAGLGRATADLPCIQMLHHENHAYYAFAASPFYAERGTGAPVMVSCVDGGSDLSASSLFQWRDGDLRLVRRYSATDSLGVFYMLCASFLGGWSPLSCEGRYMGAAAWGDYDRLTNPYYKPLRQYFYFGPRGEVRVNNALIENGCARLQEFVGTFLDPAELWNPDAVLSVDDITHSPITRARVDKAAAVQMVFEDALFHIIADLLHETGGDRLVLCGGTALNCIANMRLLEHFGRDFYRRHLGRDTYLKIWVPPIPSDQGVVPGAAFQFAMRNGIEAEGRLPTPFLCGTGSNADAVRAALDTAEHIDFERGGSIEEAATEGALADFMAYMVAQGGVVGIYQGAAETGPRALGHRSFLADPRDPATLDLLNSRVKLRERIRPLAPMVTREDAERLFELEPGAASGDYDAYDYMVLNTRAKEAAYRLIPAVIHQDGTSRIQIVRERNNRLIHRYLRAFGRLTGVEVSVNTSLNVGGPIVQRPEQALELFKRAKGLDCLVMIGDDRALYYVWAKAGVQRFPSRYAEFRAGFDAGESVRTPEPAPPPAVIARPARRPPPQLAPALCCSDRPTETAPRRDTDPGARNRTEREILTAFKAGRLTRAESKARLLALRAAPMSVSAKPVDRRASDIAIIGLSGRFPDAEDAEAFWNNLIEGRSAIRIGPEGRGWAVADYYDPEPRTPAKTYSRHGAYLAEIDRFDPLFFGIAPREAERMDPSERLFLQEAWRAIEDAGYAASRLDGANWGVFACAKGDYEAYVARHDPTWHAPSDSYAPARLSYLLNLCGPCVAVDTACSSTLAAIAMACDALALGNAEVAVAGGGGVYTTPNMLIYSSRAGLFSPTGRCAPFDAGADGTVLGEAVGAVVLKPLAAALADGDPIRGVIKAWGVNQDGRTNGMTAPSGPAQTRLIDGIYRRFGIDPGEIGLAEAHGTGTRLGDPIEVQALVSAFAGLTDRRGHCALGSVKGNIGHAFFGAGVAGLTKVLKAMEHGEIPPSLNIVTPNPLLELDDSPFVPARERRDWPAGSAPRMAAVSAFGATGVNVHLAVAEPPIRAHVPACARPRAIVLSARDKARLHDVIERLAAFLAEPPPGLTLDALAYTLQTGREPMDARIAFMADSLTTVRSRLETAFTGTAEVVHQGLAKPPSAALELFAEDDDLREAIARWVAKGKEDQLLRLWVAGLPVDWRALWPDAPPMRVHLPTYPFAKERCWIAEGFDPVGAPPQRRGLLLRAELHPAPATSPRGSTGPLAIVGGPPGLADAVAAHLPNARVLSALAGEDWSGVVDLAGAAADDPHALDWIAPLQRLVSARRRDGLRLLAVTQGAPDNRSGALRGALYAMLSAEYPGVRALHLDLDEPDPAAIAAEYRSAAVGALVHRGGARLVPTLRVAEVGEGPRLDASATVWITGGTRGLGLLCARHLVAKHGARRLVLMGRSTVLTKASAEMVAALRADDVAVTVAAPDLTDQVALQALANTTGPVGALIHCAGGAEHDDPAFISKPRSTIERVLMPKTRGLDTLLRVLAEQPLAYAVLFSSVAGLVPILGSGQSDYAMANAYMDKVAAGRHPFPVVALQWPSWRDSGAGVVETDAYRATGLLAHSDAEGLDLLDRALGASGTLLPAVVDPTRFDPQRLLGITTPSTEAQGKVAAASAAQPETGPPDWLLDLVADSFGIARERFDPSTPLADYGADSILLTQLQARIDRHLGEKTDPSVLIAAPTLEAYATWLRDNHATAFAIEPSLVVASPATSADPAASTPSPAVTPSSEPPTSSRRRVRVVHIRDLIGQPAQSPHRTMSESRRPSQAIAVIGMACRFPDAPDLEGFWRLLSEGRSAIRSAQRPAWGGPYQAALLDDLGWFDPNYFLIPSEDASAMDPQAFLLLEVALAAMADAGYRPEELRGARIGVYIGARSQHDPGERLLTARNPIVAAGQNYLAANCSQFFDLRGPSLVVDTACSSALVAMDMAVKALAAGEIEAALVGGVNALADDCALSVMARRGLLAEEPAFHLFDARARGVVLGEGAGMVLLKPLAAAQAAGERVRALLRGLAINNDGRTVGPATPNSEAQQAVMRAALERAGATPDKVGYLEANGSGSEATDLLELNSIRAVYRPAGGPQLLLGSVKPHIGHPLCAEGIAAFIKTALTVAEGASTPFLSAEVPLAHFDLAASPLAFARAAEPWPAPMLAAINCFADGGANAHAILSAPAPDQVATRRPLEPPELNRIDVLRIAAAQSAAPAVVGFTKHLVMDSAHPVLAGHRAHGRPLLPGLGYVDLLYGLLQDHGYAPRAWELRNLVLFSPLGVDAETDAVVKVALVADGDGWRVEVTGREEPRAGGDARVMRYATAELRPSTGVTAGRLDLAVVLEQASETRDLAEYYEAARAQELHHSGAMRARGRVHEHVSGAVIEIAADAIGAACFHPALLDGAAVAFAGVFERVRAEPRLYLPLSMGRFCSVAPVLEACVARIPRASVSEVGELLTFGLEMYDLEGRMIAELTDIKAKLVRAPEHLERPQASTPTKRAAPTDAYGGDEGEGDAEGFLIRLLAKHLGCSPEEIDPAAGYYEMGLDSLTLLELVAAIEARIGSTLAPTLLFEHVTPAALAAHLTDRFADAWQAPPMAPAPVVATQPALAVERTQDVAVIGLAGRYPQSPDLRAFWNHLLEGADCITETPPGRWDYDTALGGVTSPSGKPMSRFGGFVADHDRFDPRFFRIAPREAEVMDPQDRLFLQTCWEAIEDAGYTPATLTPALGADGIRAVGVFCGIMHKDYTIAAAELLSKQNPFPLTISYAPIPNRVSYCCGFHGPSMAVDTVCSSSLTAIHMALESLRAGESRVAIAGGVNLSLHPAKYLAYGVSELHSLDGRCRAFGAGGTGYVSAEGVGAAILKPLAEAERDGDHIYAVIKGSAINHVGKVSGITVPSPIAQAALIRRVHEQTGIDPRTVGYVEAHGTGTALGDPIEIEGLTRAYRTYTDESGFCAIGSVKSNMGHSESAAGIMGFTKAVLQLSKRTLVPSLHAKPLNPHIDFDSTPFRVQLTREPWEHAGQWPRRAGVSAFGATGSNVHVLLEEYSAPVRPASDGAVLLPLSARTGERLLAYARRLLDFLAEEDPPLGDLAYTFQIGREALPERLAVVAAHRTGLMVALDAFIAADGEAGASYARAKAPRTVPAGLIERAAEALATADLDVLARCWVEGAPVDFSVLARRARPMRMSAPTYPFARERYWVEGPRTDAAPTESVTAAAAAPAKPTALIPVPPAPGEELAATLRLTGDEFYLRDHVIGGAKILPGLVTLDTVLKILRRGPNLLDGRVPVFHDVAWIQRVVVDDGPVTLRFGLTRRAPGEYAYTVEIQHGEAQPAIQGTGLITLEPSSPPKTLDLAECARRTGDRLILGEALYRDYYQSIGFDYGPTHQTIEQMHLGPAGVLVSIAAPEAIASTVGDFALHPALLDAALQGTIGLDLAAGGDRPRLPFGFDSISVWAPLAPRMVAWIRSGTPRGRLERTDIDVTDETGRLLVRMEGLTSRLVEPVPGVIPDPARLYVPVWRERDAAPATSAATRVFIASGLPAIAGAEVLPKDYAEAALRLFARVKSILVAAPGAPIRVQVAVADEGPHRLFRGLAGLLRTARLENPIIDGQIVLVPPGIGAQQLALLLVEEAATPERLVRHHLSGTREVPGFEPLAGKKTPPCAWREGGIYLITGGAGGIGRLIAEDAAARMDRGTVILAGRSRPAPGLTTWMEGLRRPGFDLIHVQVDVTDTAAVTSWVRELVSQYGPLAGVIHGAGIVRDDFVIRKSETDFAAVLAPKVAGAVAMDAATAEQPLDFYLMLSSGAGVTGNLGQADYASANAYLDAFAALRAEWVAAGRRSGVSLAIDWPLWRYGGMGIDSAFEARMTATTGMVALETAAGIDAFHRALAAGSAQVLVMAGETQALDAFLRREGLAFASADPASPGVGGVVAPGGDRERIAALIAKVVKIAPETIDGDAPLEDLGIDSILSLQIVGALEDEFGPQPKTLLFEYPTLDALVAHLAAPTPSAPPASHAPNPRERVAALIAEVVKVAPEAIDGDAPLEDLGIDSILSLQIVGALEAEFGPQPKTLLFDHPTLDELVAHLAAQPRPRSTAATPSEPAPTSPEAYPLPPSEADRTISLAYGQRAFCFLYDSDPNSAAYNVPFTLRVRDLVVPELLRRALYRLVMRHAVLRATFPYVGERRVQHIAGTFELSLLVEDASGHTDRELKARLRARYTIPFDLEAGPLIRAHLIRRAPDDAYLLLVMHHIVCDGWSLGVLVQELGVLLECEHAGVSPELPDPGADYAAFVATESDLVEGPEGAHHLAFWETTLAGDLPTPELPHSRPRPPSLTQNGATYGLDLPRALVDRLRRLAREEGASLFAALLAGLATTLHRVTGESDVLIGAPFSGRTDARFARTVGDLINPVALRCDLSGDPSPRVVLTRARATLHAALPHQAYPFARIVERLGIARDAARSPIFEVMLNFIQMPDEVADLMVSAAGPRQTHWGGLAVESVEMDQQEGQMPLTFETLAASDTLYSVLKYNPDLFERRDIERLGTQLRAVLEAMVTTPDAPISGIDLPMEETAIGYPRHATIHSLFAAQVASHADSLAVIGEEGQATYAELDASANRIAHALIAAGVVPGAYCGLYLRPGVEMIAAVLGVLKAGGIYVPIDPEYPEERVRYMVEDCGARIMIAAADLAAGIATLTAVTTITPPREGPETAPTVRVDPDAIAYVIYTSGSTGRPKGCMISHRNVVRLMVNDRHPFAFGPRDVWIMAHSYCFDFSVWEMYGALLYGGRVLAPSRERVRDVGRLLDLIEHHRVTVLNQTPGAFHALADEALARDSTLHEHLRYVVFGGDKLVPARLKAWVARYGLHRVALINMYGITETTVHVTHHRIKAGDLTDTEPGSPIGVPIPETRVVILDDAGRAARVGEIGELHVGGSGVALGYLGRPKLTAERFIDDPFTPGQRLYRSGDLARWEADGTLRYFGRNDHQVKIRGHRIEVQEIEQRLLALGAVRDAVVLAWGEPASLVAFVTPAEAADLDLLADLATELPSYMLPARVFGVAVLPLTDNGKIHRAALLAMLEKTHGSPPHDDTACAASVPAPDEVSLDDLEARIAESWGSVLGLAHRPGRTEDYFALGGDSLNAGQMVARLRREFGVKITLPEAFRNPTIAALASVLRPRLGLPEPTAAVQPSIHDASASIPLAESTKTDAPTPDPEPDSAPIAAPVTPDENAPIPRNSEPGPYPLTHAQQRIWVLERMSAAPAAYTIPLAYRLTGRLDDAALARALTRLVERHESLRTVFVVENGIPVQRILPAIELAVTTTDLSAEHDPEASARSLAHDAFTMPFDLARGPLVRATVLRLAEHRQVLVLTMHHIIADGGSLAVLFEEFGALYGAFAAGADDPLAPPGLQYRDYVRWQISTLATAEAEEARAWWLDRLGGERAILAMPTDRPRPQNPSLSGRTARFALDPALSERLVVFARERRATLFTTLLTLTKVVLYKLSGTADLLVGTPVSGRTHPDLAEAVGLFVNTVVLRHRIDTEATFEATLARITADAAEAFARQDVPFDWLVETLSVPRDPSRSPLFDVMIALLDRRGLSPRFPGLETAPFEAPYDASKVDLTIEFVHGGEAPLEVWLEYSTDLFDASSIERIWTGWVRLCSAALAAPDRPIATLPFLAESEPTATCAGASLDCGAVTTVVERFERQVAATPTLIAVIDEAGAITYAELERAANRLAHVLDMAANLAPDEVVALVLERSRRIPEAMLAVLKAGAAYLPIDPETPDARVGELLEDAVVRIAIAEGRHVARLRELGVETLIDLDGLDEGGLIDLDARSATSPAARPGPDDLAYVVYTSGSTGAPKGVAITHGALSNLVGALHHAVYQAFAEPVEEAFSSNYAFDVAAQQVFCTLCAGHRLRILPTAALADPRRVRDLLREQPVQIIDLTPSQFAGLLESGFHQAPGMALEQVTLGSEALPVALLRRFYSDERNRGVRVLNMYGPSEACVDATLWRADPDALPNDAIAPIGTPLANIGVAIVNADLQPLPVGVEGEIVLAGMGLARGYLNRPDLTAKRFVRGPSGERLYRTGDRGVLGPDRVLRFRGRDDDQVKLRGLRIELGEIEAALRALPGAGDAAVTIRGEGARAALIGYIVASPEHFDRAEIRRALELRLPKGLIPTQLVRLDRMPLTAVGKIDRAALPVTTEVEDPRPPANATETRIAALIGKVLGRGPVDPNDNFFDIGGSSLAAVQVLLELEDAFGVELPLLTFYRNPSARGLAMAVGEGEGEVGTVALARLNDGDGSDVFALPPVFGYGAAYQALADALTGVTLWALDLPETEDPIAACAAAIEEAAPAGALRLLGYSSGGNLAFEVAKRLEASGRELAGLYLLDSVRLEEAKSMTPAQRDSHVAELYAQYVDQLRGDPATMELATAPGFEERMRTRTARFIDLLGEMANEGGLIAPIHLVTSSTDFGPHGWVDATTRSGVGPHEAMLFAPHAAGNAAILSLLMTARQEPGEATDEMRVSAAPPATDEPWEGGRHGPLEPIGEREVN